MKTALTILICLLSCMAARCQSPPMPDTNVVSPDFVFDPSPDPDVLGYWCLTNGVHFVETDGTNVFIPFYPIGITAFTVTATNKCCESLPSNTVMVTNPPPLLNWSATFNWPVSVTNASGNHFWKLMESDDLIHWKPSPIKPVVAVTRF